MYSKLKEKLKEKVFSTKELEIQKIVNKGIYHLLHDTNRETNDIEMTIIQMVKELKKLL